MFRATDRLLRRPVAIKLYRPGAGSTAERQFRDESRQLAWLEHPNLVTLYDAGLDAGQPFLVLQYIDGVTLEDRLDQGALSADQAAAVGARLADALAYVHERDVVHRDLRPSNILVDESGIFISDFGISRMLGGTHLAASGLQTGTSAYLAPEQLRRGTTPQPESDIYSLGLVLIECLTGEPQFPGGALASAVARLTMRPRVPEGLPEPMRDALEAMTDDDPAKRPTAEECRAAFVLCDPEFHKIPDLQLADCGPVADPVRPVDPDADTIADNVLFFPFAARWADPDGPPPAVAPETEADTGQDTQPVAGVRESRATLRRAERISRMEPLAGARPRRALGLHGRHLRGWLKLAAASAAAAALATGLIQLESASADEGPGTSQPTP
jgi:serine/threonine protein kinase